MTQGQLIVLEGGEGAGKTSLAQKLKNHLDPGKFVFTREPGGTPFAEEMRKVIFANNDDPFKEICLFFAARRDHVMKLIRPVLASGKNVISDRYVASTYAYQIFAPGRSYLEDCFGSMVKLAETSTVASADEALSVNYIWLDGDVGTCLMRRVADGGLNSFDARSRGFHEGVRKGFTRFFEFDRGATLHFRKPRWFKVNAELSQDEIFEKALEAISEITRDRRS